MSWSNIWPSRWFRAKKTYPPRKPTPRALAIEVLEDRLTPAPLALPAASLPLDAVGQAYSATLHATGGDGAYRFALVSGAVPNGISLSSTGLLSGETALAGSFTFTAMVTDKTLTATKSYTLTVTSGAATILVVSAPASATAGAYFSITVTATDANGNTATGFTGPVTLTASDGQTVYLAATPVFHNGTAIIAAALDTADTLTLTATSGTIQGTTGSIRMNARGAAKFVVTEPGNATAGQSFAATITAEDAYGNIVTAFSSTATLLASDGQAVHLEATPVFIGGTANVLVTLNKPDTLTLTAVSGSIMATGSKITVSPGSASRFVVSEPTTAKAGSSFTVTLTAKDALGNTITGFAGNVTLTASDGQTVYVATSPAFRNGIATVTVTLDKADALTLTAVSGTTQGTGGAITVSPAAAASFAVSAPGTATAGEGFSVTITAKDAFGNIVTGFSGNVALSASDGQTVFVAAAPAFHNGTATVIVTLDTPDTLTLTATSGTITGSGGSTTVNPNPNPVDWFSQNLSDPGLQALARSDFNRDGALTYSDMLGLFAEVEAAGAVTAAELQSLRALATASGAAAVNMASSVENLTYKVVDGDPANALYHGASLGNLKAGSSAAQLTELVDKWFLGEDRPTIDTEYTGGWGTPTYQLASGTLFGSGGPSYKDVAQGEEGDCWLLSSFGVTAANDASVISSMFTDDGTTMENGVQVHVWTVRFYNNGVASYLTVDNYVPAVGGVFAFADLGQTVSSTSNVLWVPLLEKAYAQLCASGWNSRPESNAYASLNGGTATTALPSITGGTDTLFGSLSQSSFIAALAAGNLLTLASSSSGNDALGIVGNHDYGVLGYNAATQTFTLLNPWGWNNTSGSPGILTLTWAQITANFELDGDCTP